jgi:hypothetical protein
VCRKTLQRQFSTTLQQTNESAMGDWDPDFIAGMSHEAAKLGHPESQYWYGWNCFIWGKKLGEPDRLVEAAVWFRKAAEQSVARAQFHLGFCYECGEGVQRDRGKQRSGTDGRRQTKGMVMPRPGFLASSPAAKSEPNNAA